jgi:sulfur carrier protein
MPSLPTISVNGETRVIDDSTSLPALLKDFGIDLSAVRGMAVAINDEVVRRTDWAGRILEEGDRVEIVTARQGG